MSALESDGVAWLPHHGPATQIGAEVKGYVYADATDANVQVVAMRRSPDLTATWGIGVEFSVE